MRLFLIAFSLFICSAIEASQIVLIIDDMGNKKQDEAAFVLPANVTFAILPNKNLSTVFAERAAAERREVMLHMPMESLSGANQETGAILSSMAPQIIRQTLEVALASVPHAVGLNNHMGSRLTQLSLPMSVTMEFLSERGLIFVDSRTTRFSKAEAIARKNGVMAVKRNVFLDHVPSHKQIDYQFHRLLRLSKKYGYAVGIAHPYPQTIDYLQEQLDTLNQHGVTLVKLTEVLANGPHYAYQSKRAKLPTQPIL